LNETYIKDLNKLILVEPYWKDAITVDGKTTQRLIKVGEYKEMSNSVISQNGEIFEYASVTDTPIKMGELIDWFKDKEKSSHPVILAAHLHYMFLRIHPFDDGNGRISRLLMNYVFYKNDLPPVIIKSEEKKDYLSALHRADVGDIGYFEDYIARQMEWSLKLAVKAALGEEVEESKDWRKQLELSKKQADLTPTFNKSIAINILSNGLYKLITRSNTSISPFESLFDNKMQILNGTKVNNADFLLKPAHYNFENDIDYITTLEKKILNQRHIFSYEIQCSFKDVLFLVDIKILNNSQSISASYNEFKYNQIISDHKIESIVDFIGSNLAKFVESNIVKS
ncbi:MAG: Fic family protein, partial [Saprospiraceae bacterium]